MARRATRGALLAALLVVCTAALGAAAADNKPSLSTVNILLPPSSVSFRISGSNGCFTWSTSRPDLIDLHEVTVEVDCGKDGEPSLAPAAERSRPAKCFGAADISVAKGVKGNATALVIATDSVTGRTLRCEVFVNRVHRLEILTTVKKIHVDEQEVLSVQGFDAQGNVFSSLEGLPFVWRAEPTTRREGVLAVAPFGGTSVKASPRRRALEEAGLQSDQILVQGTAPGRALVSATLSEPGVTGTTAGVTASVTLAVVHQLELDPYRPVWLAPASSLQYRLLHIRRGERSHVEMPRAEYRWSVDNASVAHVDPATGLVTALAPGTTTVRVRDATVEESEASAVLHVTFPAYLKLAASETDLRVDRDPLDEAWRAPGYGEGSIDSVWSFVRGRRYDVHVACYDASHRPVLVTPEFRIELAFDDHLAPHRASGNGAHARAGAALAGPTVIDATLLRIHNARTGKSWEPGTPVTARQPAAVHEPIRAAKREALLSLDPSALAPRQRTVVLPADPSVKHTLRLHAAGGSGALAWSSADPAVAPVDSRSGLVTGAARGATVVTVVDPANPRNNDSLTVVVSEVGSLGLGPGLELPVGSRALLPVTATDRDARLYDNCSALPVQVSGLGGPPPALQAERALAEAPEEEEPTGACAALALSALREGRAAIEISMREGVARGTAPATVYAPLRVLYPPGSPVLVALGSQATFVVEGGPLPWLADGSTHVVDAEAAGTDPDAAAVVPAEVPPEAAGAAGGSASRRAFTVLCLKLHEQPLRVRVTNRPSPSLARPAELQATVQFACAPPASVHLRPAPAPGDACGPRERADGAYVALADREAALEVSVWDAEGRAFHNASTLAGRLYPSDAALLSATHGGSPLDGAALRPSGKPGSVTLTLAVTGYDADRFHRAALPAGLRQASATAKAMAAARLDVQGRLQIVLVEPVSVQPSEALLLLHKSVELRVRPAGGSGRYALALSPPSGPLSLSEDGAVRPTALGQATLRVRDAALPEACPAASAALTVAEPAAIHVAVADKVPVGSELPLRATLVDSHGRPFAPEHYPLVGLEHRVSGDPSAVSLVPLPDRPGEYRVQGLRVGDTRIAFVATPRPGATMQSESRPVEVYGPLEIVPPVLALMPGSSCEVVVAGGPRSGARIVLSPEDATIADVTPLAAAPSAPPSPARFLVVGRAVGSAPLVGRSIPVRGDGPAFGEARANLTVSLLSGVRIHLPTSRLAVGERVPAYVVGLGGETPYTFALSEIAFRWDSAGAAVALDEKDSEHFGVNVAGRQAGRARLSVRVTFPSRDALEAHADVTVFEPLRVFAPPAGVPSGGPPCAPGCVPPAGSALAALASSHALVAPGSLEDLASNRPGATFAVAGGDGVVTLLEGPPGRLRAGAATGTALVRAEDRAAGETAWIAVSVRNPAALELLSPSPQYLEMAAGSTAEVRALLRDDTGAPLGGRFEVPPLDLSLNAADVASASLNGSAGAGLVMIRALAEGAAVLRVGYRDKVEAFLKIVVREVIVPAAPTLHVGARLRFQPTQGGEGGAWQSDDPSVLSVDEATGEARAVGAGVARVSLASRGTRSQTLVTVSRVASVEVAAPPPRVSGGPAPDSGLPASYSVPLTLTDDRGVRFSPAAPRPGSPPLIDQRFSVSCAVDEAGWARAEFDLSGPACIVTPVYPPSVDPAAAPPASLTLRAAASDPAGGYVSRELRASVPFSPAFFILGYQPSVRLTPDSRALRLEVAGATDALTAASADPSRVGVAALPAAAPAASGLRVFEVRVLVREGASLPESGIPVEFTDRSSGQRVAVSVLYDGGDGAGPAPAGGLPTAALLSGSLLAAAAVAVFLSSRGGQAARPPRAPVPGTGPPLPPRPMPHTPAATAFSPAGRGAVSPVTPGVGLEQFQHEERRSPFSPPQRSSLGAGGSASRFQPQRGPIPRGSV